jgi:hypothetical protein
VNLMREVDDCRAGLGVYHESVDGEPWSEGRVAACNGVADSVGAARAYSEAVIDIAKMPEMVTLCHSPVEHHDSPACVADIQKRLPEADRASDKRQVLGEDVTSKMCDEQWELRFDDPGKVDQALLETCDNGFYARMGDLRYHQVNVIRTPQTPSPWGIMVDADDPRTGEKIHASINIWSHVNDLASQGQVDMMRYIKGELKTEDVTNGTYVRDWARAAEAAGGKGALGTMDRATVERRKFAAVDGRDFKNGTPKVTGEEQFELDPEVIKLSREFQRKTLSKIPQRAHAQLPRAARPLRRRDHEMGHSVALRHNFVSSADALNYRPQYWQLRTKNGTVTDACDDLSTPRRGLRGPALLRPGHREREVNLLWMFMQSSSMDYAGEATQDLHRPRRLRLRRGPHVLRRRRWRSPTLLRHRRWARRRASGCSTKMDSFGGILGLQCAIGAPQPAEPDGTDDIHYSQLQRYYRLDHQGLQASSTRTPSSPRSWDTE